MKLVKRAALILIGLAALVYAGDYAVVRVPIPSTRNPYGSVVVRPYYDVGLKSGKSTFYFLDPQTQTCVNSLFPHMDYPPCWYLKNHTHPKISM